MLKETKREKRKKKKGVKQISDSETCEIKPVESEMIESLETEEMAKDGRKKKRKRGKRTKLRQPYIYKYRARLKNETMIIRKIHSKRLGILRRRKLVKIRFLKPREQKDKHTLSLDVKSV